MEKNPERSIAVRRLSLCLFLFLITVILIACQPAAEPVSADITACTASCEDIWLGVPVCSREQAKALKDARRPSDIFPALYTQDGIGAKRHELPLAQYDRTPTYYLPLAMDGLSGETTTLSCDSALFVVADDPLPETADAMRDGHRYSLLICGEAFYQEAALVCTGLPVLTIDLYDKQTGKITASTGIERTPASPMYFSYYDPCDPVTGTAASAKSAGKIHTRGGTSAKYDKHSFKFSLYHDITCVDQNNIALCGLRYDEDWVLNAMYQEETKVRDMLAYDLWEDIGADHYGDGTVLGTRMRYVEVILGGKYWGLYGLCEPEDAKQFGISGERPGCVYKVSSWVVPTVKELRNAIIADHAQVAEVEVKYPEVVAETARDAWKPFLDYVEITYESSDFTFTQQIDDIMDEDNLADMWIFLNVIVGRDNRWKNLYLSYRADYGKLVMAPWDCDISFGLNWGDGDHESLHLYHEPYTFYEIQDMPIFNRYLELNVNDFRKTLADRWNELRGDWLSVEEILTRADTFRTQLEHSGALNRNRTRWPKSGDAADLSYIEEFVSFRIPFLDEYIASLSEE